jgi:integrase
MEARSRLQDLDFDRKQLKVVQGKGKKDRYVPLSIHLIRGLKNTLQLKTNRLSFNGQPIARSGDFDSRYSQRGVQWAVKTVAKSVGITKDVHVHSLRHTYATHLLEDGYYHAQRPLGHQTLKLRWNICK